MKSGGPRVDRREAISWMLTAAAAMAAAELPLPLASAAVPPSRPAGKGYGRDPDVVRSYRPGELWPLTFDEDQRRLVAVLCDLMIPADDTSPSASAVGVPDFIDEWVSSPYPGQAGDRKVILEGLAWIDAESDRRWGMPFANLIISQQHAVFDDICDPAAAPAERKAAAAFFKKFRDLTAGGYYTTPEGMKAIGYVGNVPLAKFEGPSDAVLRQIGITSAEGP